MKIRELTISARARVCLLTAGYEDIEDLENVTDEELLKIRNLNEKGVAEIRTVIDEYFAEEDPEEEGNEFEDITIFHDNGEIEVTVDFCGLEFNEYSETIKLSIWASSNSETTYKIWIKDLYINGTRHKQFSCIGGVADYDSDYLEQEIYNVDGIDYEDIRNIRFLIEIDDKDDNKLANSKVVTLSCDVDKEMFFVESIKDYEDDADIMVDGENYSDPRDIPLDELELSVRTYNCLKRAGIVSLGEICEKTMEEMEKVRNLGGKSLVEVLKKLSEHGLKLKNPDEEFAINTNDVTGELFDKYIDEMGLSIQSYSCLRRAGINTIGDLCSKSLEEMMKIRNLGRKRLEEVLAKLKEQGLSLRSQDDSFYFMASYPENIKDIARKKEEAWEYRLFIEAAIYKYESLNSYRKQRVVFWEHEDYFNRIESTSVFTDFIQSHIGKLHDFVQKIADCINGDVNQSFGEPGESGDVRKIIAATEKLMKIYKDMIAWKLSFGNIDADYKYRNVLEQFCSLIESALENIDVLYDKLHVAKRQFEDLLAGRITDEELHVDLNITCELKSDGFRKALEELQEPNSAEVVVLK